MRIPQDLPIFRIMKWLKYRTKWAHGYSSWEYRYFNDEWNVDELWSEIKYDLENQNNWSDKYRGAEYEEIPFSEVPVSVFNRILGDVLEKVTYYNARLDELKAVSEQKNAQTLHSSTG